ncbi:Hypothetical protein PHPALM_11467 [Phytophthora palmivora]|uniref:Putative auto-transporter adhesin head GIN domain-containing protein n=1 Tax=Phytophthora palmivora TaxID=4796 RepID=A0A2P4Y272_9STRA|nr:Hypothetical protein PHPALM_11467 [Phytophthora palmivora]
MGILSSPSASGMEISATTASKSKIPHWLGVQCEAGSSPSCDAKRVDAVSVHGSHDVFIRYEQVDHLLDEDNMIARVRVIKGDVHDQKDIVVQLSMTNELLTLDITASRKTVEIVLLQKDQLQRLVNQGSGDVVVEDHVVVTMGPHLSIATLGSGNTFVTSTETVGVNTLTLNSKGSGLLQTSFSELRVSTLRVEYYSSGDLTVFVNSASDADTMAVIAEGSGDACLSWTSPMAINQFEVQQVGSGDVSVGPQGSCRLAKVSMLGSGELDVGGVQCDSVDVDLMSSGKVVVHATNALDVEAYGSGHVQFTGSAPHAIASTGYKPIYPQRVDDSYLPTNCKRHKIPAIKAKYAALSSGVLASAELDSTESSPSTTKGRDAAGDFWGDVNHDKDSILPLTAIVFLVAMILLVELEKKHVNLSLVHNGVYMFEK